MTAMDLIAQRSKKAGDEAPAFWQKRKSCPSRN